MIIQALSHTLSHQNDEDIKVNVIDKVAIMEKHDSSTYLLFFPTQINNGELFIL